jgi:cyclic pyranopterin phosphate synthase
MNPLNHFDDEGLAHMVDVGAKTETERVATAAGSIRMRAETLALIAGGGARKGDVLGVARIAGIQGAKRAAELIPLAHPIAITKAAVVFEVDPSAAAIHCRATVHAVGRTGVEMEAMSAVSAALLTIYDMVKAADRGMVIGEIRLLEKRGGKSGDYSAP